MTVIIKYVTDLIFILYMCILTIWRLTTYIYIYRTAQLTSRRCILNIYQQIYLLNVLNMLLILSFFFSSRCRLFHNVTFFGSCNINILNTECAKIFK